MFLRFAGENEVVAVQGTPPFQQRGGMESTPCLRRKHRTNACSQKYPRSELISKSNTQGHSADSTSHGADIPYINAKTPWALQKAPQGLCRYWVGYSLCESFQSSLLQGRKIQTAPIHHCSARMKGFEWCILCGCHPQPFADSDVLVPVFFFFFFEL